MSNEVSILGIGLPLNYDAATAIRRAGSRYRPLMEMTKSHFLPMKC